MLVDELPIDEPTDVGRWVNAKCTLADGMTKQMLPES